MDHSGSCSGLLSGKRGLGLALSSGVLSAVVGGIGFVVSALTVFVFDLDTVLLRLGLVSLEVAGSMFSLDSRDCF